MTDDGFAGDVIRVQGLTVRGHHGVYEHERADGQDFVIDVDVAVDLARAAASDDVDDTVHYGILAERIHDAVANDPVDLIETVAERCAAIALSFAAAQRVRVTVHKPQAPITVPFEDVSVTIVRGRS